jgi:hypothetical protein
VAILVVLGIVAYFGYLLIRESLRPDFLSRPSGTFLDGFTRTYRIRDHPLFGDQGHLVLRVVGIGLTAIGGIGILAMLLRDT